VLDHRVYRTAFLPALVAVFVLAFSLSDPPAPETTRLAPLAFDAERAFGAGPRPARNSLMELAAAFPDRRPGSAGDTGLAARVQEYLVQRGFASEASIKREPVSAETVDGEVDLENVIATRQGLSNHTVVIVAHRDAASGPAVAELSGTVVLMELGRLLADRDLAKTVMLASVSGGSGGFAGARAAVHSAPGPVDAVFVLGDLAGTRKRRPYVVPFGLGSPPAPYGLERTVQVALREELEPNVGRVRATVQAIRRAVPLTLSEQGPINDEGFPAVLISSSGERRPAADTPVKQRRFAGFGRGTLRALTATLAADGDEPFERSSGIVVLKRLVPTWAVRLVVLALLLPALITAFDAFFRVRRRGLRVGAWTLWVASFAVPFLLAWGWARGLGAVGAVETLPAPTEGVPPLDTAGWAAMGSALVIGLGAGFGVRPLLLRAVGRLGHASSGAAAAAIGFLLSSLTLAVWLLNPFAAFVILPATHAWLLICAPEHRPPRGLTVAALVIGLLLPLGVVAYYVQAWDAGLWTAFGLVSGGSLGLLAALSVSAFAGLLCATLAVLRARRRLTDTDTASEEPVSTRGPKSYAGPGSLGGTESALRR
jgi:hypothetical protein